VELKQFFFKTLIVAGTIAGLYGIYQVRSILILFFGAILFASTIRPIVLALSTRGVPAIVSILIIFLGVLGGLVGTIIFLVPTLLSSFTDLLNSQTVILQAVEETIQRILALALNGTQVKIPLPTVSELQTYVTNFQNTSTADLQGLVLDSFNFVSEALILFVMAFYWFTERDHLEELALKMLRLRHREKFIAIFAEIESTLGAYVRGQTILCVTVGIFVFIALTILGVRSVIALAVFAALVEAIPMIGPFLGAVPAILIALLDSPEKALLVALAFVIIQQIEAQILVPKVMERQVGLSPLYILLAITMGNLLGGLLGAVIAIPIVAAVKVIVREFLIAPTVEARKFPVMDGGAVLLDEEETATPTTETPDVVPPGSPIILSK